MPSGGINIMNEKSNPLDELKITREHIIALHEAYTHTNKRYSKKRAERLLELLNVLKQSDDDRNSLQWDEDKKKTTSLVSEKSVSKKVPKEIIQLQENLSSLRSAFNL
jgi:hypothetical protein